MASEEFNEAFLALREMAFGVTADELGVSVTGPTVLALVVDLPLDEGLVSLACTIDPSASLYFSWGGGVIGAGERPAVQAAVRSLLETAVGNQGRFRRQARVQAPSSRPGFVQFILVTTEGHFVASRREEHLGDSGDALYPLYQQTQAIIQEILSGEASGCEE